VNSPHKAHRKASSFLALVSRNVLRPNASIMPSRRLPEKRAPVSSFMTRLLHWLKIEGHGKRLDAMSFDLLIFEKEHAPINREPFLEWYGEQMDWKEDHTYGDPAVATRSLQAWLFEMFQTFPATNGAISQNGNVLMSGDYSIRRSTIYASFAWSMADHAYETAFQLAAKHGVGFFNVSSDQGEVWLSDENMGLSLAHSGV